MFLNFPASTMSQTSFFSLQIIQAQVCCYSNNNKKNGLRQLIFAPDCTRSYVQSWTWMSTFNPRIFFVPSPLLPSYSPLVPNTLLLPDTDILWALATHPTNSSSPGRRVLPPTLVPWNRLIHTSAFKAVVSTACYLSIRKDMNRLYILWCWPCERHSTEPHTVKLELRSQVTWISCLLPVSVTILASLWAALNVCVLWNCWSLACFRQGCGQG